MKTLTVARGVALKEGDCCEIDEQGHARPATDGRYIAKAEVRASVRARTMVFEERVNDDENRREPGGGPGEKLRTTKRGGKADSVGSNVSGGVGLPTE